MLLPNYITDSAIILVSAFNPQKHEIHFNKIKKSLPTSQKHH
jgi:hypothetical protein